MSTKEKKDNFCCVSLEDSIHARKCFMTGEYCSKQTNIQKERAKLHEKKEINAFVIMNFSDMSDVVYKWRMKEFIESIKKYLYIDDDKLYCRGVEWRNTEKADDNEPKAINDENRVKKIHVLRSDTEPASNYVVCNRICQQLQIADLIIVDVSSQNPNVFYELGMAISLGKLILPICYSESYYKMVIPEKLQKMLDDYTLLDKEEYRKCEELKHHIDCYPWRRKLFEYYGILYRRKVEESEGKRTRYDDFEKVKDPKYGFTDVKYGRFPYHEEIKKENDDQRIVGQKIYDKLKEGYNQSDYCDNTVIVYTLDSFLNDEQAGVCIINYYRNITKKMKIEKCFCGERVGVLVQENVIPESDKDSKGQLYLNYNIGEIIHIGVNQATYLAAEEKIKATDVLNCEVDEPVEQEQIEGIMRYIKGYIRNKGLLVYPNNPVYVERVKNNLQSDIVDEEVVGKNSICNSRLFVLYHIMLRTLRYTNQIVVDISNNNLQSLFWLGAAHGRGIHAITVLHNDSTSAHNDKNYGTENKERKVFDVAGLWTAVFQSNDTDGLYKQLAAVYEGIERHSKLMLPNRNYYEHQILSYLNSSNTLELLPEEIRKQKDAMEEHVLESYYRNCFLSQMLCYNKLNIYLGQGHLTAEDKQPKGFTSKWDFQAVSALSNYLSKRTLIGEYHTRNIVSGEVDNEAEKVNFICIGQNVTPLGNTIAEKKNKELGQKKIHKKYSSNGCTGFGKCIEGVDIIYRGFCHEVDNIEENENRKDAIAVQQTNIKCATCSSCSNGDVVKISDYNISLKDVQSICNVGRKRHVEIGQIVLWREEKQSGNERTYFWVELNGGSGPATLALATLFTNEEQKRECLENEKLEAKNEIGEDNEVNKYDLDNHLLCKLQQSIRKEFMEKLKNELCEKLREEVFCEGGEDGAYECHIQIMVYTVLSYLSTILYRYFLPFLLEEDINYIHNSVEIFVKSMRSASKSPFALNYERWRDPRYSDVTPNKIVNDAVDIIPKVLKEVLNSFKGVEAFYKVMVEHGCDNAKVVGEDTRKVLGICELEIKDRVNCLFTN